jgi:hypothetical protein
MKYFELGPDSRIILYDKNSIVSTYKSNPILNVCEDSKNYFYIAACANKLNTCILDEIYSFKTSNPSSNECGLYPSSLIAFSKINPIIGNFLAGCCFGANKTL